MSEETTEEVTEMPKEIDPAITERAQLQGWVPKEQFRGNPDLWKPADEWVQRADDMMPILKATNSKLEKSLTELKGELNETKETMQKMTKMQTKYVEDAYNTRMSEIEDKKRVAVAAGDAEGYDRLVIASEKISKPEPVVEKPTRQIRPEFSSWKEKNKNWYGVDEDMTIYADSVGMKLVDNGHDPDKSDFYDVVKNRVKAVFPNKFENPNQNKPSMVDEGTNRDAQPANTSKKTWSNLPAEAKEQCKKLVGQIPGFTKEKYVSDYFEEE